MANGHSSASAHGAVPPTLEGRQIRPVSGQPRVARLGAGGPGGPQLQCSRPLASFAVPELFLSLADNQAGFFRVLRVFRG